MENIKRKKVVIIFIYSTLFLLFSLSLYLYFRPQPSCFDGKQNQNEQGIDCGGVCVKECDIVKAQPLIIGKVGAVSAGVEGKYDFYAWIINPNVIFGSQKFTYTFKFKNSAGEVIFTQKNNGFILPSERKYIVVENVNSAGKPVAIDLRIDSSDWIKFKDYYESPNIKIINKSYNEVSDSVNFAEVYGLLKNESPYDFNVIKVEVFLKDVNGKVVALNSTQMNTVNAGEQRDFKIFWPHHFDGSVNNMEVQAEVNIFNSQIFIKKFFKFEKFQQY